MPVHVGYVGNDVGGTYQCSEVGSTCEGVVAVQMLLRLTVQIYVAEDGTTVACRWELAVQTRMGLQEHVQVMWAVQLYVAEVGSAYAVERLVVQ